MRTYRISFKLIPASFKLVDLCCFSVLPTLPCIASYIDLSCMILAWAYCHVLVLCAYRIACFFSLLLVLLRSWGFACLLVVRLQGIFFVFFMDPFFFLAGSQARWPYPRNHFYLCLLVARSIAMPMLRYPPLAISCLPYCHVKPLTHLVLANHCLAMLPLCSAPLIALLVAGEVEDCSMVDCVLLGYHHISYIINASIYLVKGGRLSLMPGVLFHSCRPSFCHTCWGYRPESHPPGGPGYTKGHC